MRYLLFFICTLFLLTSCKDKQTIEEIDINYGYDYFPLNIGSELVYRVDSIIYDPTENNVNILNNTVYIKEVVVDTFRDELSRLSHRIERFERPNVNIDWQLTNVWSAVRTDGRAERFEDNLRFIKLVFPVDDGDLWDGNLFVDDTRTFPVAGEQMEIFKSWTSEVIAVDELESVGDFNFDEVMTVQLADEENLVEKRYGIEKYVAGVGLVYKELEIYDTQNTESELAPWEEKAEKGFKLVMTLVDYK